MSDTRMQHDLARDAHLRIFGVTIGTFVALLIVSLLVVPDMMDAVLSAFTSTSG